MMGRSREPTSIGPARQWLPLSLLFIMATGCEHKVSIGTGKFEAERRSGALAERDQVQSALAFLEDYDRYPQEAALGRVLHHLRKWSENVAPDTNWIADPMYGRLPGRLGLSRNVARLARLTFAPGDVIALREIWWHRRLARQLATDPVIEDRYSAWLTEQKATLPTIEFQQLSSLMAIFDWVIRNIQIEPQNLTSAELEGGQTAPPETTDQAIRPGVRRTAWEALQLGRGDALCRARLIALIARQLEIPVVLLALDKPDEPAPFLLAGQVGDQWYLFEPELGLPVERKDQASVATWNDWKETPTLLHQFDLPKRRYTHRDAEPEHVLALIDATAVALSQRMRLLEQALPSDQRAVLTVSPTALRRTLEAQTGIRNAAIWTQPYDVDYFRRNQFASYPGLIRALQLEMQPLTSPWPLAFARRQHIRGVIFDEERHEGAMRLYMVARLSDRQIQQVNSPEALQAMFQRLTGTLAGVPQDPEQVRQFLAATQHVLRMTRQNASFWLGLISYDLGNYRIANDYFDKWTLAADPTSRSPWYVAALYNLGRSCETWGRETDDDALLRRAAEYYQQESDSPQGPGNQLRARRLDDELNSRENPDPSGE